MLGVQWLSLLVTILSLDYILTITTPAKKVHASQDKPAYVYDRCSHRIEARLDSMRRRDVPTSRESSIDLTGYALHHPLESRSYDMYVTGMQVKVPGKSVWFRVEQCQFEPRNRTLETKLIFRDLSITGQVRLYEENVLSKDPQELPIPIDACNMTIRFRRAGLGLLATPMPKARGKIDIETQAQFLEPNFVSVHAYGCRPVNIEHRTTNVAEDSLEISGEKEAKNDLTEEIEDVFLRGVKTLLTSYMEKQLKPALRETLMMNLGYTLSYGKR